MRCMSLFILLKLWYGRIASWDIRVLVVFARIWPPVTDIQHYYYARYPTDDWQLACMFSFVYFSVKVCLVGVFPILLAYGQIPASGPVYPSWTAPYRTRGETRFSTWAKRDGVWTDAPVWLHYWVVIWVAGYCNPPYFAQFLGYVMGRIHRVLRSYSVLHILLPLIIIIMQECSQALKTCKRL